jgi:hypothetical protein
MLVSSFANAGNPVIGKVVYVDGKAILQETSTVQGLTYLGVQKTLKYGDKIFVHNLLKTLDGSLLKVSFADGAEITLRADTDIFIEKYNNKEAEIEVIKGGVRVVTGEIAERNPDLYKVTTDNGVVTARKKGSDFSVRICDQDCDEENKAMAGPKMKTSLPVIAKVVALEGEVIVVNKNKRTLGLGYPLYSTEHLVSSKDSYAQLQFVDGSSVTIQAESEFTITDFEYNETGKENRSIFKLQEGGLRFVTGSLGKQNPDAFKLHTSVATIGIRGTDFAVNTVGAGVVSHVFEGSINQSNKSGSTVLEAGSYSVISSEQSSPVVTASSSVTFDNNIAPSPSQAHVDTKNLFSPDAGAVDSGTHVSVKQGEVAVVGSTGKPVTVGESLSSSVGQSGSASNPAAASDFQMLDPACTSPATVAVVPTPVPSSRPNTIIIGGASASVGANAAAGSTPITTIVIQEQTIATPYNY